MTGAALTWVIAQKFGNGRIVILSDTMISHPDTGRRNTVPGRLKAVVLSPKLSIAYAGRSIAGIIAAKEVRNILSKSNNIANVLEYLTSATVSGDCDFLVASHLRHAELFKVQSGRVSEGSDLHWIGDPKPIRLLREGMESLQQNIPANLPDYVTAEETILTGAFNIMLLQNVALSDCVGGFAINLLASPYGHTYQTHGGSFLRGPIVIGGDQSLQYPDRDDQDMFGYNILDSGYRGAPILGAYVDQLKLGYIYNPLQQEEAVKIAPASQQSLLSRLKILAEELGGVSEVDISFG